MDTRQALITEHLLHHLRAGVRHLRTAVAARAALNARLDRPGLASLCITDDHVTLLLDECDRDLTGASRAVPDEPEADDESDRALRAHAAEMRVALPFDALACRLRLGRFERQVVSICAATALEPSVDRVFAYLLDDLNLREPTVELFVGLGRTDVHERLRRRRLLGAAGVLRRCGVLLARVGQDRDTLRLAPQAGEFLLGGPESTIERFRDEAEVDVSSAPIPPHVDRILLDRLAQGLRSRRLAAIGIWGPRDAGLENVVAALASGAERPLRRLSGALLRKAPAEAAPVLAEQIDIAQALDAVLWVSVDSLSDGGPERLSDSLADALAAAAVPVVISGAHAWRPSVMLARPYAEIDVPSPSYANRRALWQTALPEITTEYAADLAARFRLGLPEMQAVAGVARTRAELAARSVPDARDVEAACASVVRKRADQFATFVKPRRGPDDLVLPAPLHEQVIEIGRFFRAWPKVSEDWGFGRLGPQTGGIKVLFTGDPGTGKTLAAEVVAFDLGVSLLRVDLARVVSKWVGETEKNLDAAFREAEDSQAVLLFDEAEALFGKRSEVQHGTDRYANLEVSFLLQRLEEHAGLVILSSNLKDQLDPAFLRRFHIVIDFPRPSVGERGRLWERAFPATTPRDDRLALNMLASFDLTGAGIVSAARTAALLAVEDGSAAITMEHAIRGCARQFRREGRLLSASELGGYASALETA